MNNKAITSFYELFKTSSVIQGTLAVMIMATICYMYAVGRAVPVELIGIVSLIIGYYFGTKTQQRLTREERTNVTTYQQSA